MLGLTKLGQRSARSGSSTGRNPLLLVAAVMLVVNGACGTTDQAARTTEPVTTTQPSRSEAVPETAAEQAPGTTLLSSEIRIERDIPYGPDERHRIDVLYRDDLVNAPVILDIHRGAWKRGDKSTEHPSAEFFVRNGFVVATPNYRLVGDQGQNAFPAPANDVGCAAAWLTQNAATYGGDPSIMVVTGFGAGGHLAALLAYDPGRGWLDDCPIQGERIAFDAFIGFGGPYDFAVVNPSQHGTLCNLLYDLVGAGGVDCLEADPALWAEANPIDQLSADDPPTLLVTGQNDCTVNIPDPQTGDCTANTDRLAAALGALGVPVEVVVLPGAFHGQERVDVPPIAWSVMSFLERHEIGHTAAQRPITSEVSFQTSESLDQDLPGVWFTQSHHPLVLSRDGTWSLMALIVKLPWTWGTYSLEGDVLTLNTADDAHLLCHQTTGTYQVAVSKDGEQIHFTPIDDACQARAAELAGGPYEKVPASMVPGDLK